MQDDVAAFVMMVLAVSGILCCVVAWSIYYNLCFERAVVRATFEDPDYHDLYWRVAGPENRDQWPMPPSEYWSWWPTKYTPWNEDGTAKGRIRDGHGGLSVPDVRRLR